MAVEQLTDAQKEYLANRCYEDFFFFAREILGHKSSAVEAIDEDGNPIPELKGDEYGISPHTPHARMLQLLAGPGRRVMLQAPRGSYKSSMAVAWILWEVIRNPNLRVLYSMATFDQARKKLRAIRNQITRNENIQAIWGNIKGEPWADEVFSISGRTKHGLADPTFTAGAVDGNLTGAHFDIIILDDIVTHQNVSAVGLRATKSYFQMVEPLLDPGGKLVVIGTRYSDADLYGDIEREMGRVFTEENILKVDCGFEIVEDDKGLKKLEGEPKFPHLTKMVLEQKLGTMGTVDFCSQYLNRCLPDELQLFTRRHFKVTSWQDWMGKLRGYILTDTAVSEADSACYSVIAFILLDSIETAYLCDLRVGKWPPNKFVEELFDVHDRWSGKVEIHKCLMERNALNKTFLATIREELLKRQIRLHLTEIPRGNGDLSKAQRIQSLQGRFERGAFWVVDGCIPTTFSDGKKVHQLWDPAGYRDAQGVRWPAGELVDQFIRFPVARYNDIPDCIADIDAVDKAWRRYCKGKGESRQKDGNIWRPKMRDPHRRQKRRGGGWMDRWRGNFGA